MTGIRLLNESGVFGKGANRLIIVWVGFPDEFKYLYHFKWPRLCSTGQKCCYPGRKKQPGARQIGRVFYNWS
jgi:hypothetical protein